jgi:hypothetical protein
MPWLKNQKVKRDGQPWLADVYTPKELGEGGCSEIRYIRELSPEQPKQEPQKAAPVQQRQGVPSLDDIKPGMTNEEYTRIAKHVFSVLG